MAVMCTRVSQNRSHFNLSQFYFEYERMNEYNFCTFWPILPNANEFSTRDVNRLFCERARASEFSV